jgi:S1-C subfamily serine protease
MGPRVWFSILMAALIGGIALCQDRPTIKEVSETVFVIKSEWKLGIKAAKVSVDFGGRTYLGAQIRSVIALSTADKAGLEKDDIILEVNGKKTEGVGDLHD